MTGIMKGEFEYQLFADGQEMPFDVQDIGSIAKKINRRRSTATARMNDNL
jgi:hypothetical protein